MQFLRGKEWEIGIVAPRLLRRKKRLVNDTVASGCLTNRLDADYTIPYGLPPVSCFTRSSGTVAVRTVRLPCCVTVALLMSER